MPAPMPEPAPVTTATGARSAWVTSHPSLHACDLSWKELAGITAGVRNLPSGIKDALAAYDTRLRQHTAPDSPLSPGRTPRNQLLGDSGLRARCRFRSTTVRHSPISLVSVS